MHDSERPCEPWREKASEMLPELGEYLGDADGPMAFWIEVGMAFEHAYEEPRNNELIARIYAYAFWCMEHGERHNSPGRDLPTCVAVCFLEHIPTISAARAEMPRWFSREEVVASREVFSYLLDKGEFEQVLAPYGPVGQSGKQ